MLLSVGLPAVGNEELQLMKGTVDQELTINNTGINLIANENFVNVQTLERCFREMFDREMGNIVDTVEVRIQNAILTASDNIVTPRIELALRSVNASSGRDTTIVTDNSEPEERVIITTSFENVYERKKQII